VGKNLKKEEPFEPTADLGLQNERPPEIVAAGVVYGLSFPVLLLLFDLISVDMTLLSHVRAITRTLVDHSS
jgi:hypothetical protein